MQCVVAKNRAYSRQSFSAIRISRSTHGFGGQVEGLSCELGVEPLLTIAVNEDDGEDDIAADINDLFCLELRDAYL
jgi:hypothetical protein